MGARAGLFPDLGSGLKDQYTLGQRFVGAGAVNGALAAVASTAAPAAAPGANRGRGISMTRTGTGLYTIAVLNNPLTAGGYNLTPQWIQQLEMNFMSPTGVTYGWVMTGYGFTAGVLSITVKVYVSSTGAATDLATTEEAWVTFQGSANTVG